MRGGNIGERFRNAFLVFEVGLAFRRRLEQIKMQGGVSSWHINVQYVE